MQLDALNCAQFDGMIVYITVKIHITVLISSYKPKIEKHQQQLHKTRHFFFTRR